MADPLVLLPGLMCDARAFGPQLAELGQVVPVTIAPLGQGERMEEIASGLIPQLPRRFALAGHGMGGAVAMEILRRAPERVARLALIATSPLPDTPSQATDRDTRIVGARAGRLAQVLAEHHGQSRLAHGPFRAEIAALMEEMALSLGPDTYVRQNRAMQRRRDQQATMRRCAVPTLVLCGAEDPLYPVKRQEFLAELIPGATLKVLAGAGHMPMLEQADATSDALRDWLGLPYVLR
ncbi:alpha/beta fold hydrolase [Mesobacterium pallidum]|uniref:alpha/beta fold hydrolase n=1 Tax=Mesobacterium pallidum TaxID=2872037 RepID=UPI001EE374CD|nr:alpha/beta hydrolase [Mesobacterium pallidum]